MLVEEQWRNATEGHGIGKSGVYEAWMETPGEAFREYRKMYGRCTGKVFVDGKDGLISTAIPVGWVFEKTAHYEDIREPYLQETWVTLHAAKPETVVTHHLMRTDTGEEVAQ